MTVALLIPTAAAAEEPPTPGQAGAPKAPVHWYGWQTLAIDAGVIGLTVAVGNSTGGDAGGMVFVGGMLLGGPIVHLAHGNPGRAGISLGLRAALPSLGFLLGMTAADCPRHHDDDGCMIVGPVVGGAMGLLAAILIDFGVVSQEPREDRRGVRVLGVNVMPDVGVSAAGARFVLRGTY